MHIAWAQFFQYNEPPPEKKEETKNCQMKPSVTEKQLNVCLKNA